MRRVSRIATSRSYQRSRWKTIEFGHMDKATWMWWLACLGGLIGMSVGFGLSWLTETAWPMDVGRFADLRVVA